MTFIRKIIFLFLLVCFQNCFSQNDCINAIVSCGNSSFNNLGVQGSGIQEIVPLSCGSQENNSLWIRVTIKTAGTLGFLITPQSTNLNVDFDFFVFGPDATCQNLGTAIRCSTTNPVASFATNNLTGMNATEFDWTEGPYELGNNYVQWMDVLENETYYIVIDRAVGNGNFSLEWTGTATFGDPPVINGSNSSALDLERCDGDSVPDEITEFDLTISGNAAIGTQTNLVASYHLTENDATTDSNAIANPTGYRNVSNPQTLYIRLENALTGCFTLAPFTLNVISFNLADTIDLKECDTDNDGFATFNLTPVRNLFNTDPDNTVSFHSTNNGTVNLPDIYTNQVAFTNEVLWVRIHNNASGCTVYKPFDIIINSTPVAVPSQITQCDFELFPDGLTTFNLTQANSALTNGDTTLVTEFYLNATDAANSQNKQNTTFNNTTNPQILTVKVINPGTGCYSLTQLTLNASTNPTITVTLENCDDSTEDGITTFNLADAGFETGGNTVSYYSNSNDALLEQNPIVSGQFSQQVIYARVENGNDCVGIHLINLVVADLPQASINTQGILCANLPNYHVTLTAVVANPGNYDFHWTPNGETTQNITVFQPGDYSVTVTDVATTCPKTVTTHLDTSEAPILQHLDVIDLVQINSVTVVVSGNGDYWYTLDDGIPQQSNFFGNVPPGTHMVSIEDRNGCGMVNQSLFVLGIPNYFTPNGDGHQDFWQIKGLDISSNRNTKIYIFNRYGKLLKQISAQGEGWNGTYNGQPMPADDYWYSVQFEDGRSAKGHFALKR